jgi:hypothetical protein
VTAYEDEVARLRAVADPATGEALARLTARTVAREQLAELLDHLRSYLHLESTVHVLFALAVAVSSRRRDGDPLWGMIVGAPSSGKTEVVRLLDLVAHEHPDEVTAPALLSWSKGKQPRPVGILTRLPDPALLTVADFSTVLATSDRGGRDQLFAMLRRAYDGEVTRDLGNSTDPLHWSGRLTILAACTPAIDNYSAHDRTLGPRWLNCRVVDESPEARRATGMVALAGERVTDQRERAAHLVAEIVANASRAVPSDLAPAVTEELLDAAMVACHGRGAVERDGYGRREITSVATVESPPRLAGQLGLLARSLLAVGLDEGEVTGLCRRFALDSVPQDRRRCLAVLAARHEATTSDVARDGGFHRSVARRALEDLQAVGVTDCGEPEMVEEGSPRPWALAGDQVQLIRRVMLDDLRSGGLARNVGTHSPLSPERGSEVSPHVSCQGSEAERGASPWRAHGHAAVEHRRHGETPRARDAGEL